MAPSDLVPSYLLKMHRAEKHLVEVKSLVEAYVGRHPYAIRETVEGVEGRHVRRLVFSEQPSNEVALAAGDVIHNVRCALDHLAGSLTKTADPTQIQFPIFKRDPYELNRITGQPLDRRGRERWDRCTHGIGEAALARIRAAQPYANAGDHTEVDGLTIIRELSNTDKHRRLPLIFAGLARPQLTFRYPSGLVTTDPPLKFPVHADSEVGDASIPSDVEVEIRGTPLVVVRLREEPSETWDLDLIGSLTTAIATVRQMIDALVRFVVK